MSVYAKERPDWLRTAIQNMLDQTVPPSEFVIVEDGSLTCGLYEVIDEFERRNSDLFKIVSYSENQGLGFALREGVVACNMPIIARMDSDDWACPERMEVQLSLMNAKNLDMVGSQVIEFIETPEKPVALTDLPEDHDDIIVYSRRRNPFRHPSMTFRREKVLEAGNYSSEFLYFEDWDLFNRMLTIGCAAGNVHEALVFMRVGVDFYARRGGITYMRHVWQFKSAQLRKGWFTTIDFLASFLPQVAVCLMPNALREIVYKRMLRQKNHDVNSG